MTPRVGGEVVPAAPRQLLLRQSSLLLPGAASTFSPSWGKKLWQFSAMHCLLEGCRCPGVCVCPCENMPEGMCSWSHCIFEAGWPELCSWESGWVRVSSGGKEVQVSVCPSRSLFEWASVV